MKRLLSIIGSISLVGTSTTSLVSCKQEKCDNKIIGNLKEMCSSNNSFHNDDNKWYFIIAKGENTKWNIIRFQNNNKEKNIYNSNDYDIKLYKGSLNYSGLVIIIKKNDKKFPYTWGNKESNNYFKNVYQYLGNDEPNAPNIDKNGNIILYSDSII